MLNEDPSQCSHGAFHQVARDVLRNAGARVTGAERENLAIAAEITRCHCHNPASPRRGAVYGFHHGEKVTLRKTILRVVDAYYFLCEREMDELREVHGLSTYKPELDVEPDVAKPDECGHRICLKLSSSVQWCTVCGAVRGPQGVMNDRYMLHGWMLPNFVNRT